MNQKQRRSPVAQLQQRNADNESQTKGHTNGEQVTVTTLGWAVPTSREKVFQKLRMPPYVPNQCC